MKIIQSFWSGNSNSLDKSYGWLSPKYHYLGWILSCNQLKKYYSEVELVTDSFGHKVLIEQLGLPYTKVHVVLDSLNQYNENLWALAKISAYQQIDQPFLHVDGDVFVWEEFNQDLIRASLIVQNLETASGYYREMWSNIAQYLKFLPESMQKFNAGLNNMAFNMGIFGGNDIEFIRSYCIEAIEFVNKNKLCINEINAFNFNIFFEQVLFYELAKKNKKEVSCLIEENIGDNEYQGFGNFDEVPHLRKYLHLIGFFKRQSDVNFKLESYVLKYYPDFYRKLENLLDINPKLSSINYTYEIENNLSLQNEYLENLILRRNGGCSLKQILGRNLALLGNAQLFQDYRSNKIPCVILPTTNFKFKNENAKKYILVDGINDTILTFEYIATIDDIIFHELNGLCDDLEFETKATEYLEDDFLEDDRISFQKTLWERIYYLISLNVLLAIEKDKYFLKNIH